MGEFKGMASEEAARRMARLQERVARREAEEKRREAEEKEDGMLLNKIFEWKRSERTSGWIKKVGWEKRYVSWKGVLFVCFCDARMIFKKEIRVKKIMEFWRKK